VKDLTHYFQRIEDHCVPAIAFPGKENDVYYMFSNNEEVEKKSWGKGYLSHDFFLDERASAVLSSPRPIEPELLPEQTDPSVNGQIVNEWIKNFGAENEDNLLRHWRSLSGDELEEVWSRLQQQIERHFPSLAPQYRISLEKLGMGKGGWATLEALLIQLKQDTGQIGYEIKNIDPHTFSFSVEFTEKRKQITLDWAKYFSNLIIETARTEGYVKANALSRKFTVFNQKHPLVANLPGPFGRLSELAESLLWSTQMGVLKEGIVKFQWGSSRINKEYEQLIQEIPHQLNENILTGTPMETLFSLTGNILAWLEMNHEEKASKRVMDLFLHHMEEGVAQHPVSRGDHRLKLAAAIRKYYMIIQEWDADVYPHLERVCKKVKIPYRMLGQIYKPRYRVTDTRGFFKFISKGINHRRMLNSVMCSFIFILFIIFFINK